MALMWSHLIDTWMSALTDLTVRDYQLFAKINDWGQEEVFHTMPSATSFIMKSNLTLNVLMFMQQHIKEHALCSCKLWSIVSILIKIFLNFILQFRSLREPKGIWSGHPRKSGQRWPTVGSLTSLHGFSPLPSQSQKERPGSRGPRPIHDACSQLIDQLNRWLPLRLARWWCIL